MMTAKPAGPLIDSAGGAFTRGGEPHRILSGSMHYFRVLPELWQDRLQRIAAMGLNTVDTYVAWNFHERRRGAVDFGGWRNLERFIGLAGDLGLDVIVRPGPYICAEWDNGGLPAWLTGMPGLRPRSSDASYLDAVAAWFDELLPRLTPLQAANGGPIVAVQVENEFGSYGDDARYLEWMHNALSERGVTELLYTADGPTELMQGGGTLPGVLASATLGSDVRQAAELLRSRQSGEPFLVAEFWNGWFDHWGEHHHVREPAGVVATLQEILAEPGGSVSFYMAHGGTNFGLWSGANNDGTVLQPTVTSYDSDAPISEHGALTDKFHALRAVLADWSKTPLPELPPDVKVLGSRRLEVHAGSALLPALCTAAAVRTSPHPLGFDELGQSSGLVLYRATSVLPNGSHTISARGLHDRAQVFVDDEIIGVLDTATGPHGLTVTGAGALVRLELLVENQGRINYGPLLGQGKGILGGVQVGRRLVQGWEMVPLDLEEWDEPRLGELVAGPGRADGQAGFTTSRFMIEQPADAFLALPGYAKGFAWVNGFLLGRYWEIGPQLTMYLPAPLLHAGENVITVLELERSGQALELRAGPELGPREEYIESF